MSHFYATIPTSARKTVPTARGHKSTGVETIGASWKGGILTSLWHDPDTDRDMFEVRMIQHHGAGDSRILARGVVGDASVIEFPIMSNGGNYFLTNEVTREVHAKG
tara:strand:+ start:444 stop:761 length:318 start_codon:yes stop_codon:yes gene_type:complete